MKFDFKFKFVIFINSLKGKCLFIFKMNYIIHNSAEVRSVKDKGFLTLNTLKILITLMSLRTFPTRPMTKVSFKPSRIKPK